jgi:predicted PurR-regulated permease PerM
MDNDLSLERFAQVSVVVIGLIVTGMALWVASPILAPTALALVIGIVVAPLATLLHRIGLPERVAAIATFAAALLAVALLVLMFQPTVLALVDQAPRIWADMRDMIGLVRGFFRGVADVTSAVSDAIVPEARAANVDEGKSAIPSLTDAILLAPGVLAQIMIFAGVLFFFLLSRSDVYVWAAALTGGRSERAAFAARLDHAEKEVSRYFLTITLINAGLGLATAITLQVIGLPNAVTWGLVAFLVNFLPYLGPAALAVGLVLAGVLNFDGAAAFLPVAAFVVLNVIEGQFVTPAFVGMRLSINPLVVFLSLVFGIWLWGPIGGIIAIPVLLWFRSVTTDHVSA